MAETQHDRLQEADQAAQSTVDDLEKRSEKVGEGIEHTKERWDETKRSQDVPTAAGDWEDTEPDDSTGDDATGFDDPEAEDDDEDEDDE